MMSSCELDSTFFGGDSQGSLETTFFDDNASEARELETTFFDDSTFNVPVYVDETEGQSSSRVRGCTSQNQGESENVPASTKRRKVWNDWSTLLTKPCCDLQCLRMLSLNDIESCWERMMSRSESEQKMYIHEQLRTHTQLKGVRNVETHLVICGKPVCPSAWCCTHNVSDWRFNECMRLVKSGVVNIRHGNVGKKRQLERTTVAIGWMSQLFRSVGDYMPHKPVVYLPYHWTRRGVYERMVSELKEVHQSQQMVIAYSHFTKIWKARFPNYTIAVASDFTTCSTCAELSANFRKARKDKTKKTLADLKAKHDLQVERERIAYHETRQTARKYPKKVTCAIIDGMDQSKTDLPHMLVKDKDNVHLARLPVHLTGVLVHTMVAEGKIPNVYVDHKQFPHDSNLTIHCLTDALVDAKEYLGEVFFLQADNCYRENKNRFILTYLASLVSLDCFKQVYLHFLPVGHTHEDIDQMFSRVSQELNQADAFTLEDLKDLVTRSYTPTITVKDVKAVHDFKAILEPCMAGAFRGHSKPHWFRFQKSEGIVYMHYKMWLDSPWQPESSDSPGLICLKACPDSDTIPDWVEPNLEKLDWEKLSKELPRQYNSCLPQSAKTWWSQFLDQMQEEFTEVPAEAQTWSANHLGRRQADHEPELEEVLDLVAIIQERVNAACPTITIGNQGKPVRGVVEMDSFHTVKEGMMVAVYMEESKGRPFIGQVTAQISDQEVTVHWWKGTWTGEYKTWNIGAGKNTKPYETDVPTQSLLLWDFLLTKKGHLSKETVIRLRESYEKADEKNGL